MFKGPALHVTSSKSGHSLHRAPQRPTAKILSNSHGGGGGASRSGGGGRVNDSLIIGGIDVSTPYIDEISHRAKCAMYRDIYYHDPLAGSAIDLMCNLPFSEFNLEIPDVDGDDSDKIKEVFESTLQRLKMNTALSSITRESMVLGAHISILVYNKAHKKFTDTIPLEYDNCEILSNILYGRDPVIEVQTPERIKKFLNSSTDGARDVISRLNPHMVSNLSSGTFELNPMMALYYPRRGFTTDDYGSSAYRRILPIYLLEKVLFRGTLTMANRRQNSITHVTAGDDEWEPSSSDLDELVNLVMQADRDPLGAVIATRSDVNINDISRSRDFWRWNDISQEMNDRKLLALGINESFMSGDATYNNAEAALTVFLENLEDLRDTSTKNIFTNKLFPLISSTQGFTKSRYGVETAGTMRSDIDADLHDTSNLIVPTVDYVKKLSPKGDEASLDMMEKLSEKGVPFGLRAWAAAGGYELDSLLANYSDNPQVLDTINDINKKAKSHTEEDDNDMFASTTIKAKKLGDRVFDERSSAIYATIGGKKRLVANQHKAQAQLNKVAAKATQRIRRNQGLEAKKYMMAAKNNEG